LHYYYAFIFRTPTFESSLMASARTLFLVYLSSTFVFPLYRQETGFSGLGSRDSNGDSRADDHGAQDKALDSRLRTGSNRSTASWLSPEGMVREAVRIQIPRRRTGLLVCPHRRILEGACGRFPSGPWPGARVRREDSHGLLDRHRVEGGVRVRIPAQVRRRSGRGVRRRLRS
jgi:hypothetical protein